MTLSQGEYVSENGGYWYSLAGQMITGLATFDKEAARSVLSMMTFENFARHYPSHWTGLWSAADTVNAVPSGALPACQGQTTMAYGLPLRPSARTPTLGPFMRGSRSMKTELFRVTF